MNVCGGFVGVLKLCSLNFCSNSTKGIFAYSENCFAVKTSSKKHTYKNIPNREEGLLREYLLVNLADYT